MPTQEDAEHAIDALNETDLGGKIFVFNEARPHGENWSFRSDPTNTRSAH